LTKNSFVVKSSLSVLGLPVFQGNFGGFCAFATAR